MLVNFSTCIRQFRPHGTKEPFSYANTTENAWNTLTYQGLFADTAYYTCRSINTDSSQIKFSFLLDNSI